MTLNSQWSGGFCLDKICILIPAYHAQLTIASVLEKIQPLNIDTIVLDDGSLDETKKVALTYGAHVLKHPFNLGKGAALQTAFRYILQRGYHVVITLDADGQHDPSEIPFLLGIFHRIKPDILIASRAEEFERMTFLRRFWNRLGAKAVSRLCHSDIKDSQSGFRLIRTEVLKAIELFSSGFEMELELLIKACKKGFSVLCVPIITKRIDGTDSSHFRPVVDTWLVCKTFLKGLFW
jgi:glycosyltransferase involved in cell wall biosynthesis